MLSLTMEEEEEEEGEGNKDYHNYIIYYVSLMIYFITASAIYIRQQNFINTAASHLGVLILIFIFSFNDLFKINFFLV